MRSRSVLAAGLLLAALPGVTQMPARVQSSQRSPYSIEFEQKREQTLADGTHIVHVSHEKDYRDSQGRRRVEYFISTDTGDFPRTNIVVYDSTGKLLFNWMVGDHMESTYTAPGDVSADVPHQSAPSTPSRMKVQRTNESLGMQEVQGFACAATRSNTTYPVGMIGNDRPLTITSERCMSTEFNLQLSSSSSDPRSGTMTTKAISISREEPNASLFQPPPGFVERKMVSVPSAAVTTN